VKLVLKVSLGRLVPQGQWDHLASKGRKVSPEWQGLLGLLVL